MLCVTVTIKAELGKIRIFEETNDDLFLVSLRER